MKQIELSKHGKNKGKFYAIVDEEDYALLMNQSWHICAGYAANSKKEYMHRIIKPVEDKLLVIDHINGNKLDNRKKNLRIVTELQNNLNKGKRKDNKSGFVGVSWHKQTSKWRVRLKIGDKYKSFGTYVSHKEASKVASNLITQRKRIVYGG